jgi:NAD(P)-dependent dehydrogenase (short-subunit alcohol dehydrogenase family)
MDLPVTLVTGASSGIGRATAELFVKHGYRVFGTSRRLESAPVIPGVEFVALDVQDDASVEAAIASILGQAERIDVLVNNAGYTILGSIEETSAAEAQALFDTNVLGVLRVSHAVLPTMRRQGGGRIVNISSVLGFLPAPFMGLYASTKHALEGLSESLDHEVRDFGIRVTLVQPNFTKTGFGSHAIGVVETIDAYDGMRQRVLAAVEKSIQSGGSPDAVAAEILRAAREPHRMRRPVGSGARLLSSLRRFMPAGPVGRSLRRTFGLN